MGKMTLFREIDAGNLIVLYHVLNPADGLRMENPEILGAPDPRTVVVGEPRLHPASLSTRARTSNLEPESGFPSGAGVITT